MGKNVADKNKENKGPDILPLDINFFKDDVFFNRRSGVNKFVSRGETDELGVESDYVLEALTLDEEDDDSFL